MSKRIFNSISLKNTTDASNSSNGGSLTVSGGASVQKSLHVGNNIYQNGKQIQDVWQVGSGGVIYYGDGDIGIRTTSPSAGLDVNGSFKSTSASIGSLVVAGELSVTSGGLRATFDANTVGSIITTGGNVGIGTANPSYKLQVIGSVYLGLMPGANQTGTIVLGRTDGTQRNHNMFLNNGSSANGNYIRFNIHSGGASAGPQANMVMQLTGNGYVGIGTTEPSAQLDVRGGVFVTGGSFNATFNSNTLGAIITTGGNVGIGITVPTQRLDVGGGLRVTGGGLLATFNTNTVGNVFTTGGNVGIGITVPTQRLDVGGGLRVTGGGLIATFDSNTVGNIFTTGGNVGIGTTAPGALLDVRGNTVLIGNSTAYAANVIPSASGKINGVNIGALNKRTRASYASAVMAVSTWTTRSTTADTPWWSVCWAPEISLFCSVGGNDGTGRAMISSDGIVWSTRSTPTNAWRGVCWAPELSLFCAVGATGTGNRVMTSPDGSTWTTRSTPADNEWIGVCWAAELSLFCAVAITGTSNRVMTSPDGLTWTARSTANSDWYSVCWAPELSLFCSVARNGSVMTSPDGITWTTRTSAVNNAWRSVCWAPEPGIFCVVGSSGTGNRVMTSPDGITWTSRSSAADNLWWWVCWAPELSLFCAVSNSATANDVMTSPDGISWTTRSTAAAVNSWISVCWAPELSEFSAVAYSGTTGNRVMTSSIALPNSQSVVKALPSQMIVNANGYVGIGTTEPSDKLHIKNGNLVLECPSNGSEPVANIIFRESDAVNDDDTFFIGNDFGGAGSQNVFMIGSSTNGSVSLAQGKIFMNMIGNVGIGTSNANGLLQFPNVTANRMIVLNESSNNDHQYFGFGINAQTFRFQVASATTDFVFFAGSTSTTSNELMRLTGDGYLGVGTSSPGSRLHVKQTSDDATAAFSSYADAGITIERADNTNKWSLGINGNDVLVFTYNLLDRGYLSNTTNVSSIDFTGQHRCASDTITRSESADKVGCIVSSTGVFRNLSPDGQDKPSINESLPVVSLASTPYDKAVYGVISDNEDDSRTRSYAVGAFVSTYEKEASDSRLIVNSVGEGGIWVCNVNGNFENGDYITSSNVPGLGMRQESDSLKNYTVAKITCDCTFELDNPRYDCVEFQFENQDGTVATLRKAFVGCTYHCG